jgi:hypothetical protein
MRRLYVSEVGAVSVCLVSVTNPKRSPEPTEQVRGKETLAREPGGAVSLTVSALVGTAVRVLSFFGVSQTILPSLSEKNGTIFPAPSLSTHPICLYSEYEDASESRFVAEASESNPASIKDKSDEAIKNTLYHSGSVRVKTAVPSDTVGFDVAYPDGCEEPEVPAVVHSHHQGEEVTLIKSPRL